MKAFFRFLAWCLATAVIVVGIVACAGWWLFREAEQPGPLAEARSILIPAHTGLADIGHLLAENSVVRYPLVFEIVAELSGRGGSLHSGEFEFPAHASVIGALDLIASGRTVKHRLTIPEGLTSPEVAALVKAAPVLTGEAETVPAEGDLFPDTYVYGWGDKRSELLDRMRQEMAHQLAHFWAERRADLPLASPRDVLILASLIEKETPREEERAHIAGVFYNRLRLGMPLQCDPTVIFAMEKAGDKLDRALTHTDLGFDSPYNTYLHKGLPPGPIANPGRSSLRAAVRPERTDDLYFVADGTGGHIFAKTLTDQSRNIALHRHGGTAESAVAPADTPTAAAAEPGSAATAPSTAIPHPEPDTAVLPAAAVPPIPPEKPAVPVVAVRRCRASHSHPCPR